MKERWRDVAGHEGLYQVSDQGRVRSLDRVVRKGKHIRGQALTSWASNSLGHQSVKFAKGGRKVSRQVHRLVLETFVGPCPPGHECRHLNGNPRDNRLENLAWGTPHENAMDRVRHGTHSQVRKTECPQGHPYAPWNLCPWSLEQGRRHCRACTRARSYVRNHPEADFEEYAQLQLERLRGSVA